jgi:membrane-associated phospholipid phosphatase
MTRRAWLSAIAVCSALVLGAPVAHAQPTPPTPEEQSDLGPGPQATIPLPDSSVPASSPGGGTRPVDDRGTDGVLWRPRRELRFGTADYVVTGAAIGATGLATFVTPSGKKWRGGILFDEDARDALRFESLRGRYWVRDMSDVGVSFATTWPFLVDALITAWWYRGRADLARNMALVSAEAFAIAAMLQTAGNIVASRERPFGRLCGTEIPEKSVDCQDDVRYRSFFSGHATLAFTSAGLVCAHHLGLGLFGKTGDIVTCAGGFAVATMTSVFRVMSDMHYASDALIGALVGSAVGLTVPILHFKEPTEPAAGNGKLDVRFGSVGRGVGLVGSF